MECDEKTQIKRFLEWCDWDIPDDELTPETIVDIKGTMIYNKYLILVEWNKFKNEIRKTQPFKTIMKLLKI